MDVTTNASSQQNAIQQRLILEAAGDYAIFTTDLQRRVTSWSAGAENLFGYTEADMLGQLCDRLYVPEDRPDAPRHELEKALAEGRANNERWHLRRDGSRIYGSGVITPLRDETDAITGVVNVMRDLTRQKQAEDALNRSEERFRAFVTATSDAVYRMSPDWQQMRQLVGKSFLPDIDTPIDSWLEQYIPSPDRGQVQVAIDEAIRDKKPFELAHRVIRADGSPGWTFSRAVPTLNQQGEITEWLGTASDITERKRVEANLAFLAEVSQDIAGLTNVEEAMNLLGAKIGGHFKVADVIFSEVSDDEQTVHVNYEWHQADFPAMKGDYAIKAYFSPEFERLHRAGQIAVVRDTANDERVDAAAYATLGVGTLVNMPLIHQNKWRFNFTLNDAKPRDWRTDEIELVRELTTRIWVRLERARVEEALGESEKKHRSLFETMDIGFNIREAIRDESGQLIDYRLLQLNPAFTKLTGLDAADAVGKTILAVLPGLDPWWFTTYQQVLDTEETVHFEQFLPHWNRWYDITAFYYAKEQFAVYYNDITERKQAEERQAYLLKLTDVLRPLADPIEPPANAVAMRAEAMQVLGEHFGTARALFWEAEPDGEYFVTEGGYVRGMEPVAGRVRIADFGTHVNQQLNAGQTLVITDIADVPPVSEQARAAYEAYQCRAYIGVPLVKRGRLAAILALYRTEPYQWTAGDIALVEETAERTWSAVERATSEAALRQSERFVQGMVTSLPLVIYIFDLVERRNHYLSPQVIDLFGYTAAEMQDSGSELVRNFFHPDDRPRLAAYFAQLRDTKEDAEGHADVTQIECRIRHRERGWMWVQCRDTVYQRDAEGRPTLLLGTAEDITERRNTNEALQKSERRLRLTIEAAELGTWEWNLTNNEVYWNEHQFRLFGMEPQPQPIGPDVFLNHVHSNDRDRVTALLQRAIAERSVYDTEFCALLDDGSERWMSGYGRVVEEQDGEPIRMSGVMFDINERRLAEDALRLADQRKNEFLALLAHELRNPLATLSNTLLILQLTGGTNEAMTLPMATTLMEREVAHLVRLVDDLLDVSRISRGKIVLTKRRTDLVSVVRQTAEAVDGGFRSANRTLTVELPAEPLYLLGDATRLKQVVSNLLNNALKFTRSGGHVWVSLGVVHEEPGKPMALLRVRDDGIGIPAHERDRIFQMFVQVDSSLGRTHDGLGLGLPLVSELVGLHGGRVAVHSEAEGGRNAAPPTGRQGSEFSVYLPIESENDGAPPRLPNGPY